jgi:dimethylamine/trimethylamine dehydrogenase
MTNEQPQVHQSFARRGITLRTSERVASFTPGTARLAHMFSGQETMIPAQSLVLVGTRQPRTTLAEALCALDIPFHTAGDAHAPGALAHVIYHAHKTARDLAATPQVRRDFAILV